MVDKQEGTHGRDMRVGLKQSSPMDPTEQRPQNPAAPLDPERGVWFTKDYPIGM